MERNYAFTLADQFVLVKTRSVYEPQASNPSGEIHEDLGLISYDKARSCYVLREFHVEGYVNQYVMEPPKAPVRSGADPGSDRLTFITEAMENVPAGWRARTVLEILSPDSFRETFDLAGPGKPWACFITNDFQRVP